MLKFLTKIFLGLFIITPVLFFAASTISNLTNTQAALIDECNDKVDNDVPPDGLIDGNDPGCWNDPNLVGARTEVVEGNCYLRLIAVGGYKPGQSITVLIDGTQPGVNYALGVSRIGFGYVDVQNKNATGTSIQFIVEGSKLQNAGDYKFEAFQGANVCTNSPTTVTIAEDTSKPFFVAPLGTKYNFGMTTLPKVEVGNAESGQKYHFKLEGAWDGDELNVAGSYYFAAYTADSNGRIIIRNICDNGESGRSPSGNEPCEDEFKEGHYVIKLLKPLSDSTLAETFFDVVTDGSGIGTYKPITGKNPCDENGNGIVEPGEKCKTAIGDFVPEIGPFAQRILAIGIGLAGGIALIIMVIGAIRVLTSAGDPKNVAAGREMIIAAVAGLLFLIFSITIMRFIGLNILGICFGPAYPWCI